MPLAWGISSYQLRAQGNMLFPDIPPVRILIEITSEL